MTCIRKSALIPYSAQKMYGLVADIDNYQHFLPWCGGSKVLSQEANEVRGQVDIHHLGLNKSFVTLNRMHEFELIEITLVEGPFKKLCGSWHFDALDENACKISLDLEFEFTSKMMSMAFGPVFSQIANTMVDAFCQRAIKVYSETKK